MRALSDEFAEYSSFHRTRGNQATHCFGIPMIIVGLFGLLARGVLWESAPEALLRLDLGGVLWAVSTVIYLKLDWRLGGPFSLVTLGLYFVGRALPLPVQLGLFAVGWVLQLVGHHVFEKKKPAFLDNFLHLLIGPLWIFAKIFRPVL